MDGIFGYLPEFDIKRNKKLRTNLGVSSTEQLEIVSCCVDMQVTARLCNTWKGIKWWVGYMQVTVALNNYLPN